jgi:F420-dependent oxidoreductase-like protein
MRLGICLDPRRPWSDARRLAQQVDDDGWASVYVCDHFLPVDGAVDASVPLHEAWTSLTALAAATRHIRLGTLVLGAAYRHPAVVANMAASLDRISDGRLVLGLGAGWQTNEHAEYGIPLLDTAQRCDRFAESCEVIDALLHRGAPVTFAGDYYTLRDARCGTVPRQSRVPLLIGGGGEQRILRIAARYADAWHVWGAPDAFAAKSAVLDQRCGEIGRDPSRIQRLTGQVVFVHEGGAIPSFLDPTEDVVGDLDQVAAQLAAYEQAGVDEFIVRDHSGTPLDAMLATVTALGSRFSDSG